jgi:hypothetical protein
MSDMLQTADSVQHDIGTPINHLVSREPVRKCMCELL